MDNLLLISSTNKSSESKLLSHLQIPTRTYMTESVTRLLSKDKFDKRTVNKILKLIDKISYAFDGILFNQYESTSFDEFLIGYLYQNFVSREVLTYDNEGNTSHLQLKRLYINVPYEVNGNRKVKSYITPTYLEDFKSSDSIVITPEYPQDLILVGYLYHDKKLRKLLKVNWKYYSPSKVLAALLS